MGRSTSTAMAFPMKTVAQAAMKAKKAKTVSKIARGRFAKALVLKGAKAKTSGGVTKDGLSKNTRGKVVSKRKSAHGKKVFKLGLHKWNDAVKQARKSLAVSGFVPINGKTTLGRQS